MIRISYLEPESIAEYGGCHERVMILHATYDEALGMVHDLRMMGKLDVVAEEV